MKKWKQRMQALLNQAEWYSTAANLGNIIDPYSTAAAKVWERHDNPYDD